MVKSRKPGSLRGEASPSWADDKSNWIRVVNALDEEIYQQIVDGHARADNTLASIRFHIDHVKQLLRKVP
jgi:hypothetical protein